MKKFIISIIILGFIVYNIDLQKTWTIIQKMDRLYALGAVFIYGISCLLAGYRFFIVCPFLSFKDALVLMFKGLTLSQVLPGGVGGDVYRIVRIKIYTDNNQVHAFYNVLVDRLMGVLGFMVSMMIAFGASNSIPTPLHTYVWGAFFAVMGVIIFIILKKYIPFFKKINYLSHLLIKKLSVPNIVIVAVGAIVMCASFYVLNLAFHMSLKLLDLMVLFPLVALVSLVPISFAGWGVREGAILFFLKSYGIDPSLALSFSLMIGIVQLLWAIPGGFLFLEKNNNDFRIKFK
jgi:uncharacterized membrane protein YbhN (UPF0104 family)